MIDGDQAGAAASLLSLDVTAPLHAAMGMRVADADKLVRTMRELIREHRRIHQQTGTVPDTLAAEMVGAMDDRAFTRWLHHLHFEVPYQQLQWCYWMAAFEPDRVGLPRSNRSEILAEYENHMDLGEIELQIASLKARDLSEWDFEMYVIRGFDHDDEDMNDPFRQVLEVARLARFQSFVERIRGYLSAEERADLRLRVANELAPLEPVEPLIDINDLQVGYTAC